MSNNKPVLALDIGGTKVASAVWTPSGGLLGRAEIETRAAEGPEAVVLSLIHIS